MSDLILELNNQANFVLVYDERRDVEPAGNGYQFPLPAFEIPFLFDRPLLVVKAVSTTARGTWRFGGTLTQRIQLGSGGAISLLPLAENQRRALRLGRTELCYFPLIAPQYQILLEAPHWLDDLRVVIWEYIGPISTEELNALQQLRQDLARVEVKVNAIASQ